MDYKLTRILFLLLSVFSFCVTQAQWTNDGSNLTTSDDVGIGTTTPEAPLEIRNHQSAGTPTLILNHTFANYSALPENNRPFVIRRGINDGEAMYTYIQDTRAHYYYKNDEAYSGIEFRIENTDTETGGGANANNNVPLYLHGHPSGGRVGINTTSIPSGYTLAVDGKAIMEEVKVKTSGSWPDYVFSEGYFLESLRKTESYIKENQHLPGIPSAQEVKEEGISLGEMNAKLLEKIEELTLHLIQKDHQINDLTNRLNNVEVRLNDLSIN